MLNLQDYIDNGWEGAGDFTLRKAIEVANEAIAEDINNARYTQNEYFWHLEVKDGSRWLKVARKPLEQD